MSKTISTKKGNMKLIKPSEFYVSALTSAPSKWIVEGMFRWNRKRVYVICGSPHSGKSTLARQIALSVAHGTPLFGDPTRKTQKTKVLYWQSEETLEDAGEDFTKSGMLPTDDENIVIMQPDSSDNNLKALNDVLIDDSSIGLVIIETLDDFLKMDDLSNNTSSAREFEKFDAQVVEAHRARCAFIVLHHFKKSDEQRGMSLNHMLGATVIAGKTDGKIYLRQVSDTDTRRHIMFQMRKGVAIEPTYLIFNPETQTSTLGITLADEKAAAKKATVSVNAIDLRSRCLHAVMENLGESKTEIAKIVGGNATKTFAKINELIVEGVIIPQGNGLYLKQAVPQMEVVCQN